MIFRQLFRNQDTTDLKNPSPWFKSLFGYQAASGEKVTVESSLGVPTVYRCINILANSVAMLPFQTFKKTAKGRERDKAHQVYFVLERRPNPYQSPFKFKHLIETHRNTWGNAYINIHWGVDGRPKELWVLNPAVTTPTVDLKTNKLWYFTSLPDGTPIKIPDDDIIHLTTLSTDGLKGKPPIQIARESIGSSQAAQKFKGKFFTNGAAHSGILKTQQALGKEAKEVLRDAWEEANTGLNNAQRIAILDAGLEFEKVGMPLKDAQFIEGMKFDKGEIANIFNIPLHMINELDRATFSNIEQQALDFIQNTLSPILIQYEEEFSYKAFSFNEQKRYYLKFNLTSLLRADSKSRAEFYKIMLDAGAFSINKVLELEDMDGIGEYGDKHRVDLNHVSIEIADEYQLAKANGGALQKGGEDD
ncbi:MULTISPECIES: phage portal protein [Bacillus]|uniref:Phage portal protein n=1 Tax=Bacillus cereus TaxID=1396 RepID=A0A9X6WVN7_BACCE|nr:MULTISPECIES: phage portal protein [Bacillus cereus group]KAA0792465.1 phage portal protein [Bacillus sp. BB56-3]MCU5485166.1 phage portal protein [Bacillus cereus]MDY7962099.1 phage portal protein [Bacillus thuringiensis]PFK07816.1 phage portal protein [Bacillus cereus]TKH48509.1 phage portal protein [Bacillus cereus]